MARRPRCAFCALRLGGRLFTCARTRCACPRGSSVNVWLRRASLRSSQSRPPAACWQGGASSRSRSLRSARGCFTCRTARRSYARRRLARCPASVCSTFAPRRAESRSRLPNTWKTAASWSRGICIKSARAWCNVARSGWACRSYMRPRATRPFMTRRSAALTACFATCRAPASGSSGASRRSNINRKSPLKACRKSSIKS